MQAGSSAPRVRLAELVSALSLGIDLGFGQPMEHVLRQCLIALRLGERAGLDEDERAVVYYTALLVNVGCHTDAHEQAKWFGDDIGFKSAKYDYEFRSVRGAMAAVKQLGSREPGAAPLPARARVRRLGTPRLRGDDRPSRSDGAVARRTARVARGRARRSRGRLRDVGRTRVAGRRAGARSRSPPGSRRSPSSSRSHTAWEASSRPRPWRVPVPERSSIRSSRSLWPATGRCCWRDSTRPAPGTPSSTPSPASPCCSRESRSTRAARDRELRRPQVALHAWPRSRRRRARRGRGRRPRTGRRRAGEAPPGRARSRSGPSRRVECDLGQARAARGR